MHRRAHPRKPHDLPGTWDRVKSGEWQYGRALALAWNGELAAALAELDAAAEKFRLRGAEEMLARVSLHREILACRAEQNPERRILRATRVAARLARAARIESYRPPFENIPGSRLAQCLWQDLERPAFLLPAAADESDLPVEDELAG